MSWVLTPTVWPEPLTTKGRGSWKLKKLYALDGGNERKPLVADTEVYVVFEVTEPLLMSPFVLALATASKVSTEIKL